jgi:hypothetical protein
MGTKDGLPSEIDGDLPDIRLEEDRMLKKGEFVYSWAAGVCTALGGIVEAGDEQNGCPIIMFGTPDSWKVDFVGLFAEFSVIEVPGDGEGGNGFDSGGLLFWFG